MCLTPGFGQTPVTEIKALEDTWNDLELATRHHVGLVIFDPEQRKVIFNYNPENYFTPASNIKILTMYAALHFLQDTLEAGWYTESGDSLIIWGGGDPGTYYPDITAPSNFVEFISQNPKLIYFADSHFQTTRFGKGWAWDDYPNAYQCERNAFPIYGNRIWIERSQDTISITPSYVTPLVHIVKDSFSDSGKSEWGDTFTYSYDSTRMKDEEEIPFTFSRNDLKFCWSIATSRQIGYVDRPFPEDAIPVYGSVRDTMIKWMMRESDNLVAEQLLLSSSMKAFGVMNEELIIDSLLRGPFLSFSEEIEWVDGSGLSRYNMVTPKSMVNVLAWILQAKGLDYLKDIMPAGGRTGTLVNGFKSKNGNAYLFAKSGSMKYTYCLSGMLITKTGKVLLFSWMNNQYHGSISELKGAMEKLFSFLYEQY